jgi:hypothetical protein
MGWRGRSTVAVLAAAVLTGAGVATMADAVSSAPAPAQTAPPAPTVAPTDDARTVQLTRSVNDLLAHVATLEQAVAAGGATGAPTPDPTAVAPGGGQDEPTQDPSAGPEQEPSDG